MAKLKCQWVCKVTYVDQLISDKESESPQS